jgi:hypothetical protein
MSFVEIASALPPLVLGELNVRSELQRVNCVRGSIASLTILLVVTVVCHVTVGRQVIKTESHIGVLRSERMTAVRQAFLETLEKMSGQY